ncbi:MAG: hypothetical protein ACLFO0_00005 [Guyparkeria sp.]
MISEDHVKEAMGEWLKNKGYTAVTARMGTAKGIDVEGVDPSTGKLIAIECKGESNAKNQWTNAWKNLSQALFNLIKESENPSNNDTQALAIPDTDDYRIRMSGLENFCHRQGIAVFWVSETGHVDVWRTNSTP